MAKMTEKTVYYALSIYSWMSVLDIKHDIIEEKKLKSLRESIIQKHLDSLVEKEFAACEKRELTPIQKDAKITALKEYKLTFKGADSYSYYDNKLFKLSN